MIFPPAILRAIQRGEVTQVRRPRRTGDPYYRRSTRLRSTASHVLVKPQTFRDGDRFPLQQRVTVEGKPSKETHGHAIITSVQVQRAGDLTFEDARAMGYRTTSAAMAAWLSDHDQAWVCEPELLGECQACGSPLEPAQDGYCLCCGCDDQARARFERKHAHRDVWVIRFQLDHSHVPRLLAAVPGREGDSDGDYVTSPSQAPGGDGDPGEALTAGDFERHVERRAKISTPQWSKLQREAWEREQETRSFTDRLHRLEREAKAKGVNVDGALWAIRQMLDRKAQADVLDRKLRQTESRVFQWAA